MKVLILWEKLYFKVATTAFDPTRYQLSVVFESGHMTA